MGLVADHDSRMGEGSLEGAELASTERKMKEKSLDGRQVVDTRSMCTLTAHICG